MREPLISVIVPVYRVEPYLRQCLDSIIGQTYRKLEIILVDDCSPDNCWKICDEYANLDKRIRVLHLPENRGLSVARNKGLDEARGEYIGFVDSDDWIEPDMYDSLKEDLEKNDAEISMCGYIWEKQNDKKPIAVKYRTAVYESTEILTASIYGRININVWNKLYCARLFKVFRFPESRNFEDLISMHRILECAKRVTVKSEPKYHYRDRNDSICRTYTAGNLIDCADAYLSRYWYFKEKHSDLFEQNEDFLLYGCFRGILRVWSWWYVCNENERNQYISKIEEYVHFSRSFLLKCRRNLPMTLKWTLLFLKNNSMSFAILYYANKLYRIVANMICL